MPNDGVRNGIDLLIFEDPMAPQSSNRIRDHFLASAKLKQELADGNMPKTVAEMATRIAASLQKDGKLMLCGNGGSAADAQHLAAELLVRLRASFNRRSLPALTLATDTSTLTACGNDFGFDDIFSRPLEGLGRAGDVLLGITTSGSSPNVIKALTVARLYRCAMWRWWCLQIKPRWCKKRTSARVMR